jgi:hypothetical protein
MRSPLDLCHHQWPRHWQVTHRQVAASQAENSSKAVQGPRKHHASHVLNDLEAHRNACTFDSTQPDSHAIRNMFLDEGHARVRTGTMMVQVACRPEGWDVHLFPREVSLLHFYSDFAVPTHVCK